MRKKDIPNLLSIIRILLVPVFVLLYLNERYAFAVTVFIAAGLTDVVDGYIARKFNYISNLGKILDPTADKLIQQSAFICLAITKTVPIWMPIVYFAKELATLIGALVVFRKARVVVKSNIFGKLATFFVFVFVSTIIALPDFMDYNARSLICLLICFYFVFSCLMYVKLEVKTEVEKNALIDCGGITAEDLEKE